MKIEEIKKAWVVHNRDVQNEVQLWNSQSEDPTYHHMYDDFIRLLEKEHMLDKSFDVLDVGCGVGVYSIALADKVHTATGLDLSPQMIGHGIEKLEKSDIKNVKLETADWNTLDLEERGMKERFDLVFAHNTPAICDMGTFEKLNDAGKRFCAVCTPIKMVEPVMQKVLVMSGIWDDSSSYDSNFSYMLDILLHKGYRPKLSYEDQIWPMNQSFEDACSFYLGRVSMAKQLTDSETEDIKDFLKSLIENGIISDSIHATVATLFWEK